MKKMTAMLLVLIMVFSLCACGASDDNTSSSISELSTVKSEELEIDVATEIIIESVQEPSPEPAYAPVWSIEMSTDEFGDVTEDSVEFISGVFQGTFSNTATTGSDLTVVVNFVRKPGYDSYAALIALREYNSTNATYLSSDTITFKMKIDGEIIEDTMIGSAPNGSVCLGKAEYSWSGDMLFNALYAGKDVRCIITIGSSEYNFTVMSENFVSLCEENNIEPGVGDLNAKEVVKIYLTDSGEHVTLAQDWLCNNLNKFERMNTAEMEVLLEGYFLNISTSSCTTFGDYKFPWWAVYHYSPSSNSGQCVAKYDFYDSLGNAVEHLKEQGETIVGWSGYREYKENQGRMLEVSIENDVFTTSLSDGTVYEYQFYKLTDDCF